MAAYTHFDLSSYFDFDKYDDKEYLSSKHLIAKQKDGLTILKYDKSALTPENVDTLGLFRSVCVKDGKVISFAPPKSVPMSRLMDKYPTSDAFDNIEFQEFVEGTMINVYWNGEEWELNTRSLVGGRGQFYKEGKTFRRMFLEAMNETGLEFDHLNKEYSYSFVFQHPENRIVVPCTTPTLYLCAVYKIDGTTITHVDFRSDTELCGKVNIPKIYSGFASWESVKRDYASSITDSVPYYVLGIIAYDKTTMQRSKLRNPTYETVRSLRGNQPKIQYQYYSLRQQGIVGDFLKYYPEYKEEFSKLRQQVHDFTYQLHTNYLNCFVFKKQTLKDSPYQFKTHMYHLHKKYLEELMPEGRVVDKTEVINFVNALEPPRLMYSLNYKLRKRDGDEKQQVLDEKEAPQTT